MELARKTFVATLLTGVAALASFGVAQAGDYSPGWKTMKPLYAVSFDVGRKHVLGYFLSKTRQCDLTVTVTERPSKPPEGDEILPLLTERFTAAIVGGTIARFGTTEGKSLEYHCAVGAQSMRVREVNQVAVTSPPTN